MNTSEYKDCLPENRGGLFHNTNLISTTFKNNRILFYFQVPFVEALDLVRSRKVYLENVSNKET